MRLYVSSDISTGRSSKRVFRLATGTCQNLAFARAKLEYVHCANLSNLPIVALIPRPICAALRANSERALRSPAGVPFASFFCASESSEERGPLVAFCFFFACARMARNSGVLSWIEVLVILSKAIMAQPVRLLDRGATPRQGALDKGVAPKCDKLNRGVQQLMVWIGKSCSIDQTTLRDLSRKPSLSL